MKAEDIHPPFWHPSQMKGFILDWDGVLANTRLDFTELRERYFGGEIVPLIERASVLPSPLCDEVRDEIRRIEMEGADQASPVEGALDFLEWLGRNQKPWVVVSRNCRDSIELAAQRCGIKVDGRVMSREDGAVKPDPQALLLAARRMGLSSKECLMVGDFIYDLLAARRASVRCVLVEREGAWGSLADAAFPRMGDFLRELDAPRPLLPWEYRHLTPDALCKINCFAWRLHPGRELSQAFCLAREGAVFLVPAAGKKLSFEEWENSSLPPSFIDRPLAEVLTELLAPRWPLLSLSSEPPSKKTALSLPDEANPAGFIRKALEAEGGR